MNLASIVQAYVDTVHLALTQVIVNGTLSSTLRTSRLGPQVSAYLLAFQPGFGEHNFQPCHRLLLLLISCTQPQSPLEPCSCLRLPPLSMAAACRW